MSDPIERLNQLRDEVEGAPMPLAAEVRRRGDRLRRRRTAAVAVGAALAVVGIVTPVAVLAVGDSTDGDVSPAGSPTTEESNPAGAITTANLMTEAETEFDGRTPWRVGETGEGQSVANVCQRQPLSAVGAEAVLERTWGLEAHGLRQVIAEFPSTTAAQSAYDEVGEWLTECAPTGTSDAENEALPDVDVPGGDDAEVHRTTYQVDGEVGGEAFADHALITGVVVAADRLAILSHDMPDADYTSVWGATSPVERMLPAAAERLLGSPGTGVGTDVTDIPRGFPIDRDLSAPEGGPVSGPGPAARGINALEVCGVALGTGDTPWPDATVDRLAASATGPASYLDARELVTFPDSHTAAAALAELRGILGACGEPRNGVVWTEHDAPALGEESLVVTRTFELGLGGDIYQFTRVGNAILAVDSGGEWELTSTVPAGIEDVSAVSAPIVDEMCVFADGGC